MLAAAAVATQSQQALLNEELKHSRSAEHLLQLIQDHGESLNAVGISHHAVSPALSMWQCQVYVSGAQGRKETTRSV